MKKYTSKQIGILLALSKHKGINKLDFCPTGVGVNVCETYCPLKRFDCVTKSVSKKAKSILKDVPPEDVFEVQIEELL